MNFGHCLESDVAVKHTLPCGAFAFSVESGRLIRLLPSASRHHIVNDLSVHIGEAAFDTIVVKAEALVI